MVQRISDYARKPRDLYETPEIATKRMFETLSPKERQAIIWEPACASGKISNVVGAFFNSDIHPILIGRQLDFLTTQHTFGCNAIITNPPFNKEAEKFIRHSLSFMEAGLLDYIVMLLPIDFDSGKTRRDMFGECEYFSEKMVLTFRLVFVETPGVKASPTTNHAWYVWRKYQNFRRASIRYLYKD